MSRQQCRRARDVCSHNARGRVRGWLSRALAIFIAAFVHASPLSAQTPPVRRDSVQRDSASADSVRRDSTAATPNHMLQVALYALVIAPAGLPWIHPKDTVEQPDSLGFWTDHIAVHATGGLASGRDGPILGASWTGSASLEVLSGGTVFEVRSEHLQLHEHVEYRTFRIGQMARPRARYAGGVTIGVRRVRNLPRHEGLEIAFPFVGGGQNAWLRLESAYVMSIKQSSWNYRIQYERRLGTGPFVASITADFRSWEIRDHGELSHRVFSVGLGTIALWR